MPTEQFTIESIETVIVDFGLIREQKFSAIASNSQSIVLIFIRTKEGIEGIGESVTPSGPWWGGESVETIKAMIDTHITPQLAGKKVFSISKIMDDLDLKIYGNCFAKAGIEMALWDIQGKSLNQPVYNLLGGKVRDSIPVCWPLATGEAIREIAEAEAKIEARTNKIFKLKMGYLEPEKDVNRAIEVAKALRDVAEIRADINERWDEYTASWAIPRMADAGISVIEQPLQRWNFEGCARLTQSTKIAHMLDESICSLQDMYRIAQLRAGDVLSLKLMKTGGIRKVKTMSEMATAAGLDNFMGTFLESSCGTGANMQLCVTIPKLPFGSELFGPLIYSDDICTVPAKYQDYELHLQEGVGLAVEIDSDKLRAFRRDKNYTSVAVTA